MQASLTTPASRLRISDRLGWAIVLLAIVGMVLSAVTLHLHYRTDTTDFCDLGDNFNCDVVNHSEYATLGPIPVAAIGLVGYLFLAAMTRVRQRIGSWLLVGASLIALAFSLYLTWVEKYVLLTWCILCLGSLGVIAVITALSLWRHLKGSAVAT